MSGATAVSPLQPHFTVPSTDVVVSIVLPTIVFCIGMVVAMLVGINKCKQWELDKIGEMRRTRRVLQRITARLREKNFKTIQRARDTRKRMIASSAQKSNAESNGHKFYSPPAYVSSTASHSSHPCGASPPPAYEDSLLDQLYHECCPPISDNHHDAHKRRRSSTISTSSTGRRRRSSAKRL